MTLQRFGPIPDDAGLIRMVQRRYDDGTAPSALTSSSRTIRVLAVMEARSVTGPAKNLIAFAKQLRSLTSPARPRVELSVVTFRRPTWLPDGFLSALEQARIPAHIIQERWAYDPSVIPQLINIVNLVRPDIIQTHNSKSHFLLRVTRLSRRFPWIAFHHGFTATNFKDKVHTNIGQWSMRGATRIVTVCDAFSIELGRAGIPTSRISVQHNSVDSFEPPSEEEVSVLRKQLGIPGDSRVVLSVGRLSSEKGHIDLIEAVACLRIIDPAAQFRLIIVGEGPERGVLEQRVKQLGLNDYVLLPGQQGNVRPYYAIADVLVLPSHSEGSPNVLLEAMAAGLPIVATAVGGTVELVSAEKTALPVESRDANSMGEAIGRLLKEPALATRLATAAKAASSRYTPEAHARSLLKMYQTVLYVEPQAKCRGQRT